jgi:AraC-like DNA-binding protein
LNIGTFSYTGLVFNENLIFPDHSELTYQKYMQPLTSANKRPPTLITPNTQWGRQALQLIKEALNSGASKPFGYGLELKVKVLSLFSLFLKENVLEDAPSRKSGIELRIKESILFMNRNYHTDLRISEIAESLEICTEYYIRSFKSLVGKTPKAFLIQYRLSHVISMMHTEKGSITSMATKCGFDDMRYFSRCFKKNFGLSALCFRRAIPETSNNEFIVL